jgi:type IV secretion system protein VirD4
MILRPSEGDKDPHWNNNSELILVTFICYVAVFAKPELRHLQTVIDLVSDTGSFEGALSRMKSSDVCGGFLARNAGQILQIPGEERGSTLSTLFEHVAFLGSPLIKEFTTCGANESFNPDTLVYGGVSAYYGLPADQLRVLNRLSRLVLTSVFLAFMRAGPSRSRWFCAWLDEIAQLGPLPILEDAVVLLRGYGVKTICFFQSVGQVSDIFPKEKAKTYLGNLDATLFFKPNDYETADEISKRAGDATISICNYNANNGRSQSYSSGANNSSSTYGTNSGSGWSSQELGRRLLKPEEVLQAPANSVFLFTRHLPPIFAWKVNFFKDKEFAPVRSRGTTKLIKCAMVMALVIWALVLMYS